MGRLTYANVVATAALVCSLGGTSYAAITITGQDVKNGSLTGADVKNSSLTGRDVRDGSLKVADFKAGQLPAGAPGPAGPKGDAGPAGPAGPKGASGATNVTVRTGTPVSVTAGSVGIATAQCQPGERATGGGAFSNRNDAFLSASVPSGGAPAAEWTAILRSPVGAATLTAYVICAAP